MEPTPTPEDRAMLTYIRLPVHIRKKLEVYAEETHRSRSSAAVSLIEYALDAVAHREPGTPR